MPWTVEQVVALAPDPSAARAGRDLAAVRKWSGLGVSEGAVWGECRGSAAQPYRACVDLAEPAFRCTCPSRKFPCKHTLGLFLILAGEPAAIAPAEPPDWVSEWLAKRTEKVERAAKPAAPADPVAAAAEQEKRARRRQDRVAAGVEELSLWLSDLLRAGMADLPGRPRQFWGQPAARMIDAQAPGLARLVGEMASIPHSGPGWPDRMLMSAGRLHLALHASRGIDDLPEPLRAELRAVLGFTESREAVVEQGERVAGRWLVLGRSVRTDERLRTQRTWLREAGGRSALVLDFAPPQHPLDVSLVPGTAVTADLAFYPAALPLRALVVARTGAPEAMEGLPGDPSIEAALCGFAAALGRNPWLERAPLGVRGVIPVEEGEAWSLVDGDGSRLPLARDAGALVLLAVSGGHPLDVFGEWDGRAFLPLSAWAEAQYSVIEAPA